MAGLPVTFVGEIFLTGLGIGGGPIVPQPPGPQPPQNPPGIWGGANQPFPTPPIANVPGLPPTQNPPGFGNRPMPPVWYPWQGDPGFSAPPGWGPGSGQPPGGGQPPGIWGPTDPRPTPPIANVPGINNPNPPDFGNKPPEPIQPPVEWKAVWHPTEGWMVVGLPNVPHPAPAEAKAPAPTPTPTPAPVNPQRP